jgi:hypothetical protein
MYNGDYQIKRTTLNETVTSIQPRLTILGAGHPFRIIEMLNSEKSFKKGADGFISRFVFCTPRPLRMSVDSICRNIF